MDEAKARKDACLQFLGAKVVSGASWQAHLATQVVPEGLLPLQVLRVSGRPGETHCACQNHADAGHRALCCRLAGTDGAECVLVSEGWAASY